MLLLLRMLAVLRSVLHKLWSASLNMILQAIVMMIWQNHFVIGRYAIFHMLIAPSLLPHPWSSTSIITLFFILGFHCYKTIELHDIWYCLLMQVAEKIILALEEFNKANPTTPLLIAFDAEDVRVQAAASTQRFEEGNAQLWWFWHVFAYPNSWG